MVTQVDMDGQSSACFDCCSAWILRAPDTVPRCPCCTDNQEEAVCGPGFEVAQPVKLGLGGEALESNCPSTLDRAPVPARSWACGCARRKVQSQEGVPKEACIRQAGAGPAGRRRPSLILRLLVPAWRHPPPARPPPLSALLPCA